MKVSRYRLTPVGWLGAVLFVGTTPFTAWYVTPPKLSEGEQRFNERLLSMGANVDIYVPSPTILILLATAFLVGAVLLLIGREIVTTEA